MSLTNSGSATILNTLVGGIVSKIGLSTTAPNADGTGITEPPAAAGYARVDFSASMGSPSGGSKANNIIIYFPESTGSWGTVTHFVLYQNNTPIIYGVLTSPVTVPSGYVPLFRVGSLVLSVS